MECSKRKATIDKQGEKEKRIAKRKSGAETDHPEKLVRASGREMQS